MFTPAIKLRIFGGYVTLAVIVCALVLFPDIPVSYLDGALKRVGVIVQMALRE